MSGRSSRSSGHPASRVAATFAALRVLTRENEMLRSVSDSVASGRTTVALVMATTVALGVGLGWLLGQLFIAL
jgi:hypothetical protein